MKYLLNQRDVIAACAGRGELEHSFNLLYQILVGLYPKAVLELSQPMMLQIVIHSFKYGFERMPEFFPVGQQALTGYSYNLDSLRASKPDMLVRWFNTMSGTQEFMRQVIFRTLHRIFSDAVAYENRTDMILQIDGFDQITLKVSQVQLSRMYIWMKWVFIELFLINEQLNK